MSKEVLGWSQAVAVDPSEVLALPASVRAVVKGKAGVTPKVFVMNPSLSESFGAYNHEELLGKNWSAIFKDAKAGVRSAMSEGTFIQAGKVVKIPDAKIEKWQSAAGSAIEAKLVAIEDDATFVFETAAGKTIRTTADKLSEESVTRAKALATE
ncbi:hypothetical protein [Roseibacillus persicicus]|uniref:hypothetical protein n=1 Tax=Roseibacillus persicicus TaxID=454148 RepID=UPI00280EE818|nr:hypothetical protein [Roseibacillus persicicus]MDQ8189139.1 hypothetical protein [Roseibacillus persicicus]